MLNILLAGVGGQGTVLAAKVLAAAAESRGWQVRSAETIGMAQRGGSVVSHVRMGNNAEQVHSSLNVKGTVDVIIGFEPAEAARVLPYLSPVGTIITATTPVQAVTSALSGRSYSPNIVLAHLESALNDRQRLITIDDAALLTDPRKRKCLNTVLLTCAIQQGTVPFSAEDLCDAIRACVKPQFVEMNLAAIDSVISPC